VVRPGILDIAPYVGGEAKIPGIDRVIKLSSNESALGPSPMAIRVQQACAADAHRYPDGAAQALRSALAEFYWLDPARIVCGNGSDELIGLLVRAYAGPGDEVLYSRHGFMMYAISARSVGATPVAAPETNLTADVDALLAAVTERTKLVFLTNPSNPTGTYLSAAEVRRLHAGLPAHVVLAIDAAYAEFVLAEDYEPGIELVRAFENVVMLRTFSKLYALADLRVGWAFGSPGIIDALNRLRAPFNVGSIAQTAAVAALHDGVHNRKCLNHNLEWREWSAAAFSALGLGVVPSQGNFLLVRFPDAPTRNADAAFEFLKTRGIIVRKMGGYHLPEYLRITIGTGEEMQITAAALGDFLKP
jgi:histidinol-phosphate aminotransferase